jgi:mannose-1-phosphate guanylyltransferase
MKQNLQDLPPSPNCFIASGSHINLRSKAVKSLRAVILAGGFGTRLRPLSCTRPKILFPIVNKPLLQWTFERLARNNIEDVIMAVFYQTEVYIKHHRVARYGVHVAYSHDPLRKPLGTGGSIRKAEKRIGHDEPFIVLNGDVFADVNYAELIQAHQENRAVATIAVHSVGNPSRYGVAELAEDNRITRFIEKPPPGTAPTNLINAGVYVFSPEIFNHIPEGRAVSIEHEVFPKLAEERTLFGHVFNGLWMDIGKPEDYLEINRKMLVSVPDLQKCKFARHVEARKPVAVDKNVHIGEKSVLGPYAVVGKDVTIGKNVHIQDSIIFARTVISDFSSINGAIIGEGVTVGERAKIEKGCIIGDHARIRDDVFLAGGISVCPANEVSKSVLTPNRI